MKRAGIFILFLCITFTASSQVWFEVGAKGMYGMKGFYNDNIINDRDHGFKIGTGLSYGAMVNVNFADKHGFTIEGILANYEQKFKYESSLFDVNSQVNWETIEGYLMYRIYNNSSFLEIGPKLSIVKSVEQLPDDLIGQLVNIEDQYSKQYWSAAFGFGGLIAGSDFFTLKMGLRFEYALTDFISEEGQTDDLLQNPFPAYYTSYDTYKASHPFSATIYLELNFAIGAIARAECGKRNFIFGSGY